MNIHGERIILRGIESSDMPSFHLWSNDPDIAAGQGEVHFPSSLWQQSRWYERTQTDERNVRLAVQHRDGDLIGYTGFWGISWQDRRAENGLLIGNLEYRKKGYGREIILTCMRYAFEEMGLHRLDATILENNLASLKAYQACGYTVEGTLREHAFRKGQWLNRVVLGVTAREYFSGLKGE